MLPGEDRSGDSRSPGKQASICWLHPTDFSLPAAESLGALMTRFRYRRGLLCVRGACRVAV